MHVRDNEAVLYEQPSVTPTRKVTAGALASAISIIIIWGVGLIPFEVPPEVASAFTTVLGFVVAYFVKDRVQP